MTDRTAIARPPAPGAADRERVQAALTGMRARAMARNLARVEVLAAAVEALALGRLGEAERAQAEQAAHSLAGSAGTFGFAEVTKPARDLEQLLGRPPTGNGEPTAHARASVATLRAALTAEHDSPPQKDRS